MFLNLSIEEVLMAFFVFQMPRGVPVATVAINNATNAGLLAVRMLSLGDADLRARLALSLSLLSLCSYIIQSSNNFAITIPAD